MNDETLRAAINREAGIVRLDALLVWLDGRRESLRDAVMKQNCDATDYYRGKHAAHGELVRLLNSTPESETP